MNQTDVKKAYSLVIVEDDVYMQNLLSHYLEEEYNVQVFDNGLDATHRYRGVTYQTLLLPTLIYPSLAGLSLFCK